VIGIAIGLPAAYFASRALRSLMYGISENDALTFAAAAGFFLLMGMIRGAVAGATGGVG
jgi:hypothetical protein